MRFKSQLTTDVLVQDIFFLVAAVVVIDEPTAGKYMGGDVSAPVFSAVVGGALRLLAVAPDEPSTPNSPPLRGQRVAQR